MQRSWISVFAATAAVVSVACTSMATAPEPPTLEGTDWVLAALPGRSLLAGQAASARFERGRLVGTDGCNRFSVPYAIRGADLEFGAQGASTRRACPPEVMAQADAYMAALRATRRYRVEGERLQWIGADGAVVASLAAQSQVLAGTAWRATAINNGKGAVASLVAGTTVTLNFGTDGRISGSGGCNRYTAPYQVDGQRLRIAGAASTRMACAAPGAMEQEQAFFKALETVATSRVEAGRLELRTAEGALAVEAVNGRIDAERP